MLRKPGEAVEIYSIYTSMTWSRIQREFLVTCLPSTLDFIIESKTLILVFISLGLFLIKKMRLLELSGLNSRYHFYTDALSKVWHFQKYPYLHDRERSQFA